MPFKTIMVLLNDSSRTEQLLDAASALARQFDAHLVGLYILPTAKIYADVGLVATPMVFEGYRDLFKSKLAEVRKKFEARAKQDGLKAEWRTVNSIFPEIAESAIAHSRSAELVVTSQIDYGPDGCIGRQRFSPGVVIAGFRDGDQRCRNQRVGAFQVVVLERRLVDLRREGDLVLGVGLHRIEVLGALGESRIKDVLAAFAQRIRIVLFAAAGRKQEAQG